MNPINDIQCVTVDVNVFPTQPPPPPPVKRDIPEKWLAIMKKYKYNWRINQLSKPKIKTSKFIAKIEKPMKFEKPKPLRLDEETKYYADQMARPLLRSLVINKNLYSKQNGKKYLKKISKNIAKAWGSIYNYYKKRARDKLRRKQRREKKKEGKQKPKEFKRMADLAKPKPVFKPEPTKKPSKIFSNFDNLDVLASPKKFYLEKQKRLGVNPAALTYEPTEAVLKLAAIPQRFKNLPKPLEPGKVKRSALRYKISPKIEALAVPKKRSEKAKEDEDYDPFTISKNALKYKATARILELAKPIERD